jgi:hypothetical protein
VVCALLNRSTMMSEMRRATWRGLDGRFVQAAERRSEVAVSSMPRSEHTVPQQRPRYVDLPAALPSGTEPSAEKKSKW